jgi:hypothetical protein
MELEDILSYATMFSRSNETATLFMMHDDAYTNSVSTNWIEGLCNMLENESAFTQHTVVDGMKSTDDTINEIYTLNLMCSGKQHTTNECIVEDEALHDKYHDKTAFIPKDVQPNKHPIVLFHQNKTHAIKAFEDTGANKSYIHKKLIDLYRLQSLVQESQVKIQVANSELMASRGSIRLSIAHGCNKVTYTFQIISVPMFDTIILGRDLLEVFNLMLTIAIPAHKYADQLIMQRLSQKEIEELKNEELNPKISSTEDFMDDAERELRVFYLEKLSISIKLYKGKIDFKIPCRLPAAEIRITHHPEVKPKRIDQYKLAERYLPYMNKHVDNWIKDEWCIESRKQLQWNKPLHGVEKVKKGELVDFRPTMNLKSCFN